MRRFRLPANLADYLATKRWSAPILFAVLATSIAMLARQTRPFDRQILRLNNTLYDAFYSLRTPKDMRGGNVVIITVDQKSLDEAHFTSTEGGVATRERMPWPWPRDCWADLIDYVSKGNPKAIVFDLLFDDRSAWVDKFQDDPKLAAAIDDASVPVTFATMMQANATPGRFAPRGEKPPILGAVNITRIPGAVDDGKPRYYPPYVEGGPSLVVQTLIRAGMPASQLPEKPFRLYYYGPHQKPEGFTFEYLSAWNVVAAASELPDAASSAITPETFRDKYVFIGISAPGFDLGPTPLDSFAPRVELHATALENILRGDRVAATGSFWIFCIALTGSLAGAFGASIPRRMSLKLVNAALVVLGLVGVSALLFLGEPIRWLPIASSLIATVCSIIFAMGWSYGIEDRAARIYLKALSQVISPAVADGIRRDPTKLQLGGQRRHMTVMFSDIAGFTDLSEAISVEQLTEVLNFYLRELSRIVFQADGTLDKYIGDAIMSFWNAPLDQPDHAIRACRTALMMIQRENEIQDDLRQLGAQKLMTRIGINTGDMAVGNLGSDYKFSYTVIGDSVNLAARLEGSNKLYNTQICLAHATAELVKDQFFLRKLDVLRVKGKKQPMAVYELMSEGAGTEKQREIAGRYEEGFRFYQSQNWDAAERVWLDLLRDHGHDGPSEKMLARIKKYREEPPEPDWDGVYVAKDK